MNDDQMCIVNSLEDESSDTQKIIQVNFFSDIEQEDIRKTKWLLSKYVDMIEVIKNYEFALQ
ncbi:hypothetical protein PPOLYM_02604 [Paenibacillus polymyxa]|jgi:hypothetical protein|nr:hypothetical protein PPOLYM_02604 [Paenibacillus polymyxa]